MMLNRMKTNGFAGLAVFAIATLGAVSLSGCGKGGGNANANGGGAGGSAPAGDTSHAGGGHADSGHADAGGAAEAISTAFDDSSADAALGTYLNRLKAGDMLGAAEVCVEEAPGTEALVTIGTRIQEMEADPETKSMAETTRALFTGDFKTLESSKMLEEDGVVVYEVSVINKAPVNIRVELRDGAWRVIPPVSGTPVG